MTIYLGVDAGNSKTAVLACLPSGEVARAALDALAEGGVTLSPEVIARLTATLPPPSFFQT